MGNEVNCQAEFSGQPQTCKALLETTSPNGCVSGVASMRLTLRMEARTSFPPFIHPIARQARPSQRTVGPASLAMDRAQPPVHLLSSLILD
jgi:hypothetical protein